MDAENVFIEGAVGIGCCFSDVREMGSDPLFTKNVKRGSDPIIVFDGRLDDRQELLAALRADRDISSGASDGALVGAAYERFGLDVAVHLSGDFAAGILDIRRRRVVLIRDAIGVKPLYYYDSPTLFLFASEIKAILSHPDVRTGPNQDAIAVFAQSRMHAQMATEATFFKNIWSVPPAHLAVREPASLSVRRYWDFDAVSAGQFAGHRPAETREAFGELFAKAVARRLRSSRPIAISVSGGLDSSAIFCVSQALRAQQRTCVPDVLGATSTFSSGSDADETRFITEIEHAWNARILRIPAGRPGFSVECAAAIWHGEAPLLDAQWNTTHSFEKTLRSMGVRSVLSGHWGDQFLVDHAFLVDLLRKGSWGTVWRYVEAQKSWEARSSRRTLASLARDLFDYHGPDALRPLLRRLRVRRSEAAAAERWYTPTLLRRAELVRSDPRGRRTAHQRSLYREARSQYHVLCMEWNDKIAAMHGLERVYPFLDRDLIALLMAVPGHRQSPNGIPKQLLRDSMHGIVPGAVLERRDKADFTTVVNGGIGIDWPTVLSWLQPGAMVVQLGFVKEDALRWMAAIGPVIVSDSANSLAAWRILEVFSLELWLQVFFNGGGQKLKEPFYDAEPRKTFGRQGTGARHVQKAVPCSAIDDLW
jgi:asparagine synthase (glutamine-hydrolysing)